MNEIIHIINPWGILTATVVGYVIGMAWYSPMLFMKPWLSALGKTEDEFIKTAEYKTKSYMWGVMSYSFLITGATAFALSIIIALVDPKTFIQTIELSMLVCFGFVVTTKFSDMLYNLECPHWGKRAQKLFLINAGYYVVMFAAMGIVFFYLR